MQPLQEGIKKETIKHPFKNIEIIYEEGKTTMTAQDKELLAAFVRLHDFELEMKNTVDELFQESIPLKKSIEALSEELKKVQASFDICVGLADKLSDTSYIFEETSLDKLTQAREQTEKELLEYHKKILEIYETAKVLQEKIVRYREANEDTANALYEECDALALAHITNWENNAINSVDFDDQFNNFREYRGVVETHNESKMDACTEAMTNYSNLNLESNTLVNVWNEFTKRCSLLKTVSDLHTKATGFAEN
jgi:uncharacterized protein YkvS